jgi:hypothetical protein
LGSIIEALNVWEQADAPPNIVSVDGAISRVDTGEHFCARYLHENTWELAVYYMTNDGQK